jgi:hypothetical protein
VRQQRPLQKHQLADARFLAVGSIALSDNLRRADGLAQDYLNASVPWFAHACGEYKQAGFGRGRGWR